MAQVFTAVIRARNDTAVVAELVLMHGSDRAGMETYIETASNFPEVQRAVDFLKSFYEDSIVSIEMKL